jgi:hypothetical protein
MVTALPVDTVAHNRARSLRAGETPMFAGFSTTAKELADAANSYDPAIQALLHF